MPFLGRRARGKEKGRSRAPRGRGGSAAAAVPGGAALAAGERTKAEPGGEGEKSPAARCNPAGTAIEKKIHTRKKTDSVLPRDPFPPSTSLLRNQREEEMNLPRPRVQGRRRRSREKSPRSALATPKPVKKKGPRLRWVWGGGRIWFSRQYLASQVIFLFLLFYNNFFQLKNKTRSHESQCASRQNSSWSGYQNSKLVAVVIIKIASLTKKTFTLFVGKHPTFSTLYSQVASDFTVAFKRFNCKY